MMRTETPAAPSSSDSTASAAAASPDEELTDVGTVLATREESGLPAAAETEASSGDSILAHLPLQLDVTIPVPSFRLGDLLALEKGVVLGSEWSHSDDVPVWCGGSQLAWTEFEVVDDKLAVRVTRIS